MLGVEGMYRVKEAVPFPPVACQLLPVETSAVSKKRVCVCVFEKISSFECSAGWQKLCVCVGHFSC